MPSLTPNAPLKFRGTEVATEEKEKNVTIENLPAGEDAADGNKESQPDETEEKEPEDKVNVFAVHLYSLHKAVDSFAALVRKIIT